jgi:copper chaperone CopZ
MTCQSCVSAVTKALQGVAGVEDYDINLEKKQVVVTGRGQLLPEPSYCVVYWKS